MSCEIEYFHPATDHKSPRSHRRKELRWKDYVFCEAVGVMGKENKKENVVVFNLNKKIGQSINFS